MATTRKLPGMTAKQGPHGVYFVRDPEASIYTETKCVIGGEVRIATCCCADAGGTRRSCMERAGNRTPCRCHCHTLRNQEQRERAGR